MAWEARRPGSATTQSSPSRSCFCGRSASGICWGGEDEDRTLQGERPPALRNALRSAQYCVIPFLLPPPKNPCPARAQKASQAGRRRIDPGRPLSGRVADRRIQPSYCVGSSLIAGWSRPERSAGDLHDPAAELLFGHRLEQRMVLAADDSAPARRRVADGDRVRRHPSDEHDRVAYDRGRTDGVAAERKKE